jgi:hypothetical protein
MLKQIVGIETSVQRVDNIMCRLSVCRHYVTSTTQLPKTWMSTNRMYLDKLDVPRLYLVNLDVDNKVAR